MQEKQEEKEQGKHLSIISVWCVMTINQYIIYF